jgi:flagellar biosynthesis protein FlhG
MTETIAFVSGKGGVGKTSLAVNSAIKLAMTGDRVGILDADFGLSNANIMMGIKADKTISDFLSGKHTLDEIITHTHAGVQLIPGGSGTMDTLNLGSEERWKIIRALDPMEAGLDYLIVDTPAGASDSSIELAAAVDKVIVILVGEPTSFMDAYAFIKALNLEKNVTNFSVIVNMATHQDAALKDVASVRKIVSKFLEVQLEYLGWLPGSKDVVQSIVARKPFILDEKSKRVVGKCLSSIVRNLVKAPKNKPNGVHFFSSKERA